MVLKKNRWYLIVLLTLILVTLVYLLIPKNKDYGIEGMLPGNIARIDRVQIAGVFDTVNFKLLDSIWYYHNEELKTRSIESLILAAASLQMKSILQFGEKDDFEYLGEFAFFDGKKKSGDFQLLKSGTQYYIYRDNSKALYGIELAGYEDYPLEKIFTGNVDQFRDHLLISLIPSEIKTLIIKPLKGESFRVINNEGILVINLSNNEDISSELDSVKLNMLLSYFSEIRYDMRFSNGTLPEGTVGKKSISTIQIQDNSNKIYNIEVFEWTRAGSQNPDIFNCIIRYNGEELYSMNYFYLDLLMRGVSAYQ